ncbi:hypothetical protein M432DRAFT_472777 [Thermoascus aurantiacus ATCC 26904]
MDLGHSRLTKQFTSRHILILKKLKITKRLKGSNMKLRLRDEDGTEEQSSRCFILYLPTELLLEIGSYLPILSKACLALTCRRFLAVYGAVLRSESLRLGKDFAPLFHHYRNAYSFVTVRWQFLNLLEDTKWRLCSKCLKLHPWNAFSFKELRRKADVRTCILGDFAGVVDLCPCKKLTFRDKLDLIDHLNERESFTKALGAQFGSQPGGRYCWHSCTEQYGATEVKIDIFPELDEAGSLHIRTEYHLSTEPNLLGKEQHITPRFGCAHRSMDLWLSSVCQTLHCRLYDSFCKSCKRISECSSCETTLMCPRKRPYHSPETNKATYFFWTERCLGKATALPDKTWAVQRIHPAESFVTLDNCRELCPWTIHEHPPLSRPPSLGLDIIDTALDDGVMGQLYSSIHMI